nr:carbonic anhydrase family protein [Candidatus Angelobacter sp.]
LPANPANRSTFVYGGRTYWLKEFHFHEPAENIINGSRPQAMEVHLVHETIDTPTLTLVVAVLVIAGRENTLINTLWTQIPEPGGSALLSTLINAGSLLPTNKAFYRFTGSLTTPPCTPGVTWIVLKDPAEFSQRQIDEYRNHYRGTARRLQPVIRQGQ